VKEVMSQTKEGYVNPAIGKHWHRRIYCYYLTDLGLALLSFYGNWEVEQMIHPSWKKKDLWTRAPIEY